MIDRFASPHHHFANFFKGQENLQPFAYAVSRQLVLGSVCLDLKEEETADELFEVYQEEPCKDDLQEVLWSKKNRGSILKKNQYQIHSRIVLIQITKNEPL